MLHSIARSFVAEPFGPSDPETTLLEFQGALERLAEPRKVAVVVPIFNGAAELRTCLDSLAATTPSDTEVILVDDHSTEAAIGRVTAQFIERWGHARTIRSARNQGFVSSVNAGIAEAELHRDVVLLNSDTIVTAGWLTKLQRAVSLRANTATANPLSNAAGVFSVPHQHRDNPLPSGWTPAMCNRVLEETSRRAYERVPSTSGFCLYVTRMALDAIGWFDDLLLKRGYGEENDFCERASAAGFDHVVDDATFVFHERALSFGPRKRSLKAQNSRVLKAIHPAHVERVRDWEARSELGRISRSYDDVISELQSLEPERVGATLRSPSTTVLASTPDRLAEQSEATRRAPGDRLLKVTFHDGYGEVDCFGIDRCRIPVHNGVRAGLVAWLANRWSAQRISLEGGVVGELEGKRLIATFDQS